MTYDFIGFQYVSFLLPVIEICMTGYCFYRFAAPFMENFSANAVISFEGHMPSGRSKRKKMSAVLAGASYALVMLLFYILRPPVGQFAGYGVGVFAAFLVMCQAERHNYEQKAFVAVTFFSLRWFSFAMAEILYDRLYYFAGNTACFKEHPQRSFALYVGVCLFYLALEFLFLTAGIWCILKSYSHKSARMTRKELIMLSVPSFMGSAGYKAIWCYRNFYIEKTGEALNVYDMFSLFYYAAAIVTIAIVIVFYENIKTGQEEKLQKRLLAAQIDSIRQHIEKVESMYRNVRSVRHDMTNHLMTLERLYAQNRTEEADSYNARLQAELAKMTNKINSGNPVTDVILQEIQKEAEERNIRFDLDFHYPIGAHMDAFDISVILNNALQNALEHIGECGHPRITIRSYCRNNAYVIEIANSFGGPLQWDRQNELPVTSKDGEGHGYGLANIRRVAEKYSGDLDIVLKDGQFQLGVLLMLEDV